VSSCLVIPQSIQQTVSRSNGLTTPTREREVLLGIDDAPVLDPQVVARTSDGGFIMSGNGNTRTNGRVLVGGAAKYDANGKELWRYSTNLRDDSPQHSQSPVFYGAAPMRDGSIYLCGEMPHPPHSGIDESWAMLTHVDANGHLLSENLVVPSQKSDLKFYLTVQYFHSCVAWGDDVAIFGTAEHVLHLPGQGTPPAHEDYYWILVLDAKGRVKWEKLIPFSEKLVPYPNGLQTFFDQDNIVLMPAGPDLILSATNSSYTEVIRMTASAEIRARALFAGRYLLTRPVVPDDLVQLWGRTKNSTLSTAISLNERLEQVQRVDGNPKAQFYAYVAYRLPDQSLCLLGVNVPASGFNGRSVILHVDRGLHHYQDFEPITPGNPFVIGSNVDSGRHFAAAPIGDLKEFAVAMELVVRIPLNSRGEPTVEPTGFKGGTVLDFVKLK
jgi:hypothetical protein